MRFIRYLLDDQASYGVLEGDAVRPISGIPFVPWEYQGEPVALESVKLLAPVQPSKVVAVGLNYKSHAEELAMDQPEDPVLFLKPPTAVIGHGDPIRYPSMSKQVDYEAELTLVIGKIAKDITEDEAMAYVFGYTCGNDVTARDLQRKDGQWTRAKGFDTFCPIGPWVETDLDVTDLTVQAVVNGEVRQSGNTADMLFSIPKLVGFSSRVMTLYPGDIILTGTPPGVGPIQPGDIAEVRIEGIGALKNPVISSD